MKANNKNRKLDDIRLKNSMSKRLANDRLISKFKLKVKRGVASVVILPVSIPSFINISVALNGQSQ